jgi:hypothetical protein
VTWMLVDCDLLNTTAGVLRRTAGQLDELTGQIFSACCGCCGTAAVDSSMAELGARVRTSVGGIGSELLADATGLDAGATVIANDSSLGTAVSAAWGDGVGIAMPAGLTVSTIGGGPGAGLGLSDIIIGGASNASLPGGLTQTLIGGGPNGAEGIAAPNPLSLETMIVHPIGLGPPAGFEGFDAQGQITLDNMFNPFLAGGRSSGVVGGSMPSLSGVTDGQVFGAMVTAVTSPATTIAFLSGDPTGLAL